jgi:hypothetical protein
MRSAFRKFWVFISGAVIEFVTGAILESLMNFKSHLIPVHSTFLHKDGDDVIGKVTRHRCYCTVPGTAPGTGIIIVISGECEWRTIHLFI